MVATNQTSERLLLDTPEAAEALNLGISKTKELIACGDLKSIKIGRRRLIPRQSIEALVDRLSEAESTGTDGR